MKLLMLIETFEQRVVNRVLASIEALQHAGNEHSYLPIHHHGQQTTKFTMRKVLCPR